MNLGFKKRLAVCCNGLASNSTSAYRADKAIKFEVILKLSDFSLFFSNRLHFLSAAKIDP